MARPRVHDQQTLLDEARAIWVESGLEALTIRALSARSGASNGVIYHAFGSRSTLLARVWLREADGFLDYQREVVDRARVAGTAADALVAAALSYADYAHQHEYASRLLLRADASKLVRADLQESDRLEMDRLRLRLGELVTALARDVWEREDRVALRLVRYCLVDLPGRLLLSRSRLTDPVAQHALRCAVRGIAEASPPEPE